MFNFSSTVPDEQAQVFRVLEEDVSKNVVRGRHACSLVGMGS